MSKEDQFSRDDEWDETNEEFVKECIAVISKRIPLEKADYEAMDSFLMYKSHGRREGEPFVYDNYFSADYNLQVSVVSYAPHKTQTFEHLFGLFTLQKEFPLTYIFRETMKERIADFFVKADVDFKEQKKFSKAFHVVTKDREKLKLLFMGRQLDELAEFPEMEVEIKGKQCLFRASMGSIDEEEAEKFIKLVMLLRTIIY
jgi:hypothetical protein